MEPKATDERDSVIQNWSKDLKKSSIFQSVDRDKTAFALKNARIMREKVENKYTPSYNQVEAPPKVPKWKQPEQEH